jgi:hypothetical protein
MFRNSDIPKFQFTTRQPAATFTPLRSWGVISWDMTNKGVSRHDSMCGRKPPSDSLFEILIDSAQDAGVRIGFDRCRGDYLLPAVLRLLDRERQKRQPDPEVIRRLEVKKAALAV